MNKSIKHALIATIFLRLVPSVLLAIVSILKPIEQCPNYYPCSQVYFTYLQKSGDFSRLFLAPWYRWDTVHYIEIAQQGYRLDQIDNTTWPPLYPLLTGLLGVIMPTMAAALIVSTIAMFFFFYLLHRLITEKWNENLADQVLLLFIVFPGSIFLAAGYSEAVFNALALACFYFIVRKKWLLSALFGGMATLTRYQGIFLAIPLIWEGIQFLRQQSRFDWLRTLLILCYTALIPVAFALNALYIRLIIHAPWPWVTRADYWQVHYDWPWRGLIGNLLFVLNIDTGNLPYAPMVMSMFFDLVFILLFIFLICYKKGLLPISYRLYGIAALIPSLIILSNFNTITGVSRFVVSVFPAFITLAFLLKNKNAERAWVLASIIIQQVFLLGFYYWIWIA
jgi:Gpi18-like mannosyltransferase